MSIETHEIKLELYNEDTKASTEVIFDVEVEIEATEYEGATLFYKGGVNIESIKISRDFSFSGKKYAVDELPNHLKKYIQYSVDGDPWNMNEHQLNVLFLEEIEHQIDNLNIEVPTKKYPGLK
jgi:hypothetical protein